MREIIEESSRCNSRAGAEAFQPPKGYRAGVLGTAMVLLAAWAAAPTPSLDVENLKAEIIAVTAQEHGLHLEFRVINDGDDPIDVSSLFAGRRGADRGSVSGVRLFPGAKRGGASPLRDADGACLCSRRVTEVLPRWHLDLEADFPLLPTTPSTVTVVIPHFPPIRKIAIEQPRVAVSLPPR